MPKIMFKNPTTTKIESSNNLSLTKPVEKVEATVEPINLQRMLRKKRSQKYMEAMGKLDAGGHVDNQELLKELIEAIREEFPEVELIKTGIFIGTVSKCFLGNPYEVHTVDFSHSIIKHYKQGEVLPDGMEKARAIAARNIYMYIEVYTDHCCAISADGTVSII